MRERRPEAVDDAEEVDVHHAAELVGLEPFGLGVDSHDRVRDVGVDAAEARDRLGDHVLDLVLLGAVGRNRQRLRAGALDLGDAVLERLLAPSGDDDLRPALPRALRNRPPEPARGPCDHDDLLGKRLLLHAGPIPGDGHATLGLCLRSGSQGSS